VTAPIGSAIGSAHPYDTVTVTLLHGSSFKRADFQIRHLTTRNSGTCQDFLL